MKYSLKKLKKERKNIKKLRGWIREREGAIQVELLGGFLDGLGSEVLLDVRVVTINLRARGPQSNHGE